jgi:hypothetical protein
MASVPASSGLAARLRIAGGTFALVAAASGAAWAQAPVRGGGGDGDRAVTIRIEISDRAELDSLTRLVGIDDVRGTTVRATATAAQLGQLRAAGYVWHELESGVAAKDAAMCPEGWVEDAERSWSCYPSYGQYTAFLQRLAAERPELCRLVDLGPTANGVAPHRLLALVISDRPEMAEDEPEVLLTSTIHGDETGGFVLLLRLADHLITGYGEDAAITSLVDETELWINPNANPDGTYFGGDDTVAGAIRFYTTAAGGSSFVDGNRNFPDPDGGDHPDNRAWWPETAAMMALAGAQTFVLSANLHGGAELVNYPWDTFARRHPDDAWFEDLARDWADLAQADGPPGYMTDRDNGITNGYDWYEVKGGRQDFMTFFHGGREVTIELSDAHLMPAEQLEGLWQWNRRALLDFVGHALRGIRGVVRDRDGAPLAATVEVLGIDRPEDGSRVRTDPAVGDFHRLLLPGLYDLRVRAAGHEPLLVEGVVVTEGEATVLDLELDRVLTRRSGRRLQPED